METIYSLVTKPINQNVAIIRISGPDAFTIIKDIVPSFEPKQNSVVFKELFFGDEFIDQALLLSFKAPNSFTGEDIIEIQSHGNMYVVQKILEKLNTYNIRQSEPGEFMKQAFMNGKIDLSQSEAINTLILSENKSLTEKAISNLSGVQAKVIKKAIKDLSVIMAHIQISIDYPENQDTQKYSLTGIKGELEKYSKEIEEVISNSKLLIKIDKGIKIALIGRPNAGKSSLLNAILDEERAIVSDVQGTTRDVVESSILLNDVKVTLQDTAGLRTTDDSVEQQGIKKTLETLETADIIIAVEEPSEKLNYSDLEKFDSKIIKVMNKKDLVDLDNDEYITTSALNKDINELIIKISDYIKNNLKNINFKNAILITSNQVNNFEKILSHIKKAISMLKDNFSIDVVALEIETIIKELGAILGIVVDQDYTSNLFASFCLGK